MVDIVRDNTIIMFNIDRQVVSYQPSFLVQVFHPLPHLLLLMVSAYS
jgi:hypothetical protein